MKKSIILSLICCVFILVVGCENNNIQKAENSDEIVSTSAENTSKNIENTNHSTFEIKEFNFENVKDFVYENTYDLSFLSEELQTKFYQAKFLAYEFTSGYSRIYLINNKPEPFPITVKNTDEENKEEYKSYICYSIDYNSFENTLKGIFTDDYCQKIIDEKNFINYNGKLACICGDRGYNIHFRKIEFELISQDENKIEFKGTAYYSSGDINDTNINYSKEYIFTIINTEDGWKFDTFPIWY